MGLHRFKPIPSGRMGVLWTLSTIRDAAIVEFGCMGHMLYSGVTLKRAGVYDGCKLYSTHINETDISLGNTDRLVKVVDSIMKRDNPRALFLTPSSIPEVIGVDIPAICEELQARYPQTKFLTFHSGGFDQTQHQGVQETLAALVKSLAKDTEKSRSPSFNIIGSCADLFRFQADAAELIRLMRGCFDMEPLCILASDTSIDRIEHMGSAHVNLVIRCEGQEAASALKKQFGTPYHVGRPYGIEGTTRWLRQVSELLGIHPKEDFLTAERESALGRVAAVRPNFRRLVRSFPESATLSLGGHADIVRGILSYGCGELGFIKGQCWCDCPEMGSEEIPFLTEDAWADIVAKHEKGWLMASGEVLEWGCKNTDLQISNPDTQWRLSPYDPPFVGIRGAVHLANLWINSNDPD